MMTCFWDGIMASLGDDDKKTLNICDGSIYSLIDSLKNKNCMTMGLKWQTEQLSDMELKQNMAHVDAYEKTDAQNGYLCSTCDPFLALLCHLLQKAIELQYCGVKVLFEPANTWLCTYKYVCNTHHFWFESRC